MVFLLHVIYVVWCNLNFFGYFSDISNITLQLRLKITAEINKFADIYVEFV